MKHLIQSLCVLTFTLISQVSFAGSFDLASKDPETTIQEKVTLYKERLELTDEQTEKMRPIIKDSIEKKIAILKSYGFSKDAERPELERKQKRALRKELKAVEKSAKKQYAEFLNKDQMKTLREIKKEQKEKRKQHDKQRK